VEIQGFHFEHLELHSFRSDFHFVFSGDSRFSLAALGVTESSQGIFQSLELRDLQNGNFRFKSRLLLIWVLSDDGASLLPPMLEKSPF